MNYFKKVKKLKNGRKFEKMYTQNVVEEGFTGDTGRFFMKFRKYYSKFWDCEHGEREILRNWEITASTNSFCNTPPHPNIFGRNCTKMKKDSPKKTFVEMTHMLPDRQT
jgi:hypothetical protein